MSNQELPVVITAISDAQFEGFVSGTLFAQGWSVVFRAIDTEAIERYCSNNVEQAASSLLIYSPDLPGITLDVVKQLSTKVKQVVGFSTQTNTEFVDLHPIPATATDLVSIVRGFVRAPMLRQVSAINRANRKAHVLAIGSAGSDTGCTTIALNLAMELSVLGKSTLLIDANFRAPSIAALIAIRNVQSESGWRTIAPQLAIAEITQQEAGTIDELMESATQNFDNIVIDLGSISGLSNRLTDRRWTSNVTTWCCDQADELMITSRADFLGHYRLVQVIDLLQQTSIRAQLSFTQNMKSSGKRGDAEMARFLTVTTALKPIRVRSMKQEVRSVQAAEDEHATMVEINERSHLRKAIAELAREITS